MYIATDYDYIMRQCLIILKLNYVCECPIIPSIMLAKLVTYNHQDYASTLGSGLLCYHVAVVGKFEIVALYLPECLVIMISSRMKYCMRNAKSNSLYQIYTLS